MIFAILYIYDVSRNEKYIYRTQLYWIYIQNINTSHHFKDIKKDLVGDYITRDDELLAGCQFCSTDISQKSRI